MVFQINTTLSADYSHAKRHVISTMSRIHEHSHDCTEIWTELIFADDFISVLFVLFSANQMNSKPLSLVNMSDYNIGFSALIKSEILCTQDAKLYYLNFK